MGSENFSEKGWGLKNVHKKIWGSEFFSEKNMGVRIFFTKIYGGMNFFTIFRKLHPVLKKTNPLALFENLTFAILVQKLKT